jgi:hypothetical protein
MHGRRLFHTKAHHSRHAPAQLCLRMVVVGSHNRFTSALTVEEPIARPANFDITTCIAC